MLGRDIKANGLLSPIVIVMQEGPKYLLLDGKNRMAAMELSDIDFELGLGDEGRPFLKMAAGDLKPDDLQTLIVVGPFTDDEANAYAIALNAHRRHLDAEAKRKAIAVLLRANPEQSDRQVSEKIGASPTTVGKERRKLEQKGDVSKVDTRKDTKGRVRPVKKKAKSAQSTKKAEPVTTPITPARAVVVEIKYPDADDNPTGVSENAVEIKSTASLDDDVLDVVCAEWARSKVKLLFDDLIPEHQAAFCSFTTGSTAGAM